MASSGARAVQHREARAGAELPGAQVCKRRGEEARAVQAAARRVAQQPAQRVARDNFVLSVLLA